MPIVTVPRLRLTPFTLTETLQSFWFVLDQGPDHKQRAYEYAKDLAWMEYQRALKGIPSPFPGYVGDDHE